jgi:sterol desaturase/sphingolipid hydroxylase (fatty acid hydroxylase superfamily)
MGLLQASESFFRLGFSLGGLLLFLGLGLALPYRKTPFIKKKRRWLENLLLNFGNGLIVYLIAPISLVGIAHYAENEYLGLFNRIKINDILLIIIGVITLDLVIYWQHRITHKVPILWRLHKVHHSDMDFDTTTAGRFHPLEILFSFIIKALCIISLGLPPEVIILFEIILNFSAMFNHSNFSLPLKIEKITRAILVTPDMHRIHHSPHHHETDSNYGFCISIWDKIFKSYTEASKEDPKTMTIGLNEYQNFSKLSYLHLLLMPFLKKQKNRRDVDA